MFDGASNALGHRIGVILTSPTNFYLPFTVQLCFERTNNIAEYEACIMGIKASIYISIKILEVYGDFTRVINQVKGEYETCYPKLIPYHAHVLELMTHFEKITFHHIPREDNQLVAAMTMLSSMYKVT